MDTLHRRRILAGLAATAVVAACSRPAQPPAATAGDTPVGVLLVAHGSKSSTWTGALEKFAEEVRGALAGRPGLRGVELAYFDEPKGSIAKAMRGFDAAGATEVIVVPLLLADESTLTNEYLQYLVGMRSEARALEGLRNDGYEVYFPRARATITPALATSEALKKNVLRRVEALRGADDGDRLGVLLVGYGDRKYGQQMEELVQGIGRYLKVQTPMDNVGFAFCGELVDYSGEPVAKALNELLSLEEQVIVVPVLLGVDERLQRDAIQAAIEAIDTPARVRYAPDAVLPDPGVTKWVVAKVDEALQRVRDAGGAMVAAPNRG